jgi:uncharacterized repeat protein (TIGR03803 family)
MRSRPSLLFWAILAVMFAIATTTKTVAASKYKVLYNFTGGSDGGAPEGLVEDAAGNLYGTTGLGGDPNCYGAWGRCGVVFKLDKAGKLTVLHKFKNGADGAFPYVTLALSGNTLYGAAGQGGNLHCFYDYGCGVLFEINIQTHALKVLHTFNGWDGLGPSGGLTLRSGVLYGTTIQGGSSGNCGYWYGCGVVYKLVLKTGAYTVLHNFDPSDGTFPCSSLTLDKTGKVLYGATPSGGSSGLGVVFRLTIKTRVYEVLYNFTGSPDAEYPYGPLALDASGNLYGDSQLGGSYPCLSERGCGTVFMVSPRTGTDTVLYNFTGGADGNYPLAGVIRSHAGTLYGTTAWGGSNDDGTVFKLAQNTETVLHTFQGSDGSGPSAVVIMDSKGDLLGTAFSGGSHGSGCGGYGCGVVWEITPK